MSWYQLAQLDILTGEIGPELKAVVGGKVKIPGFVVPLEQSGEIFLLAPYAGACIHTPTPPANQIVFVEMESTAKAIDPWTWHPIWVTGTLEVTTVSSPYGSAGFKLIGTATEEYK